MENPAFPLSVSRSRWLAGERPSHEIAALHASEHRRASHLAAHQADQIELDAIADVLDGRGLNRVRQQINRVVQDPPHCITKTLGSRPAGRAKDRAWVSAVVRIERYRLEHDVTDGRTAIDSPTIDVRDAWNAWQLANDAISNASEVIAPRRPVAHREPNIAMRITGPSLDIGL